MTGQNADDEQNDQNERQSNRTPIEKRVLLLSLSILVIGSIGYFSMDRSLWLFYAFSHIGALGVMGLFGGMAGILAKRKGHSFWMAYSLCSLLPIIMGIVSVLAFLLTTGQLYCGGSISLVVAVLTIVIYTLVKKKVTA